MAATALALLILVACSDGTGPTGIASIQLLTQSGLTLGIGESVTIDIDVRDTRGRAITDQTLNWTTSNPLVATVDGSGRVTAVGVGTATITASASGLQDSITLMVGPGPSSGCGTATSFTIGEVRVLTPEANGAVCLPGGASYTLVVTNSAQVGSVALRLTGTGLSTSSATLSLSTTSPGEGPPLGVEGALVRDWGAETDLRNRARTALQGRAAVARAASQPSSASGLRLSLGTGTPAVGSLLHLNASIDPCDNSDPRVARVMSVSRTTIVVADTTNPKNGFINADYDHIAATMDTLVVPVVTDAFGTPSDIDSNGRVVLFYTKAVNAMTGRGDRSYVGGFFYSRDLFPTQPATGMQGCAGSNVGELMYMLAPDPNGEVNGNVRRTDFVREATIGVAAHELQHLVNASRRLFVVKADAFDEESWLDEGLSHIAEELVFYQASGFQPGQNIDVDDLRQSSRTLTAFNRYAADNLSRLVEHLRNPATTSPYLPDDELSTRGAAWSFLRYLADRRGGNQNALWKSLVDSKTTGLTNLRAALGADPLQQVGDWAVATAVDDLTSGLAAAYTQPSWNFRSVYTALESTRGAYPLSTIQLGASDLFTSIVSGGSAYVPMTVATAGTGEVRILSGGAAPTSNVRIVAVRTR